MGLVFLKRKSLYKGSQKQVKLQNTSPEAFMVFHFVVHTKRDRNGSVKKGKIITFPPLHTWPITAWSGCVKLHFSVLEMYKNCCNQRKPLQTISSILSVCAEEVWRSSTLFEAYWHLNSCFLLETVPDKPIKIQGVLTHFLGVELFCHLLWPKPKRIVQLSTTQHFHSFVHHSFY